MTTEEQHNAAIQEGRDATRAATLKEIAAGLGIKPVGDDAGGWVFAGRRRLFANNVKRALEAAYEAGREAQRCTR